MTRIRGAGAVIALLASLSLAGCSGSSGADKTGADALAFPNQDINPHGAAALKPGGTLHTVIEAYPAQWNSNHVDGQNGDWMEMDKALLPHLFRLDPNGTPQSNPSYLTSAGVTATTPHQVVTYTINPQAKWSDGTPITWTDFRADWQALNGRNSAYKAYSTSGYEQISAVEKGADEREVKVTYDRPFGDWKSLFDPLYPASGYGSPEQFNKGWIDRPPVTAGAWKIASLDQTKKLVTFEPDPTWWGPKPVLSSIVWDPIDPSAQPDAFLNSELDIAGARAPEIYKRLKDAPNGVIRKAAQSDESQITFNGARGPLQDVKVRQALQLAVDRDAIAKVASAGLPLSLKPLNSHFYMPGEPGYRDNSAQFTKRDVKAAGRLLDEAGWALSGKTRTKGGRPLKLSFTLASSNVVGQQIAQLVQKMYADIGVQLTIQPVSADDFFGKYVNAGNFDLTLFRYQPTPYLSQSVSIYQQVQGKNGGQNVGRIGTSQIDRLLDQAEQATDPKVAGDLYNQADTLIWQAAHSLPLYQTPQVNAVRKDLANYGASGLGEYDYATIGFLR